MLTKIKDFLSDFGGKNGWMEMVYYRIKYAVAIFLGKIWSEERYAKWFYHLYTGKDLNLDNPQRFDEKVWWLKLNNRDPMLTMCSDKISVRKYVANFGYSDILIQQLAVYDNANEIPFDSFKEEVVVKCNHNSGGHFFYNPQSKPYTPILLNFTINSSLFQGIS